ncbi:hypothetical protein D9M69_554840 [compost metagenome]
MIRIQFKIIGQGITPGPSETLAGAFKIRVGRIIFGILIFRVREGTTKAINKRPPKVGSEDQIIQYIRLQENITEYLGI